jgi:hypothetical protein
MQCSCRPSFIRGFYSNLHLKDCETTRCKRQKLVELNLRGIYTRYPVWMLLDSCRSARDRKGAADLRGHVGEVESVVHGSLGALVVHGRGHVAPIIPTPVVVAQLASEALWNDLHSTVQHIIEESLLPVQTPALT